jgi:hypothetical protein
MHKKKKRTIREERRDGGKAIKVGMERMESKARQNRG